MVGSDRSNDPACCRRRPELVAVAREAVPIAMPSCLNASAVTAW